MKSKKSLKIAVIHPVLAFGGVDRLAVILANELTKRKFDVTFLYFEEKEGFTTIAKKKRIQLRKFPFKLPYELKLLLNLDKFLKEKNNFDVFIITGTKNFILSSFLSKNKKVIHYLHFPFYQALPNLTWFQNFLRKCYNIFFCFLNKISLKYNKNFMIFTNSKLTKKSIQKVYPYLNIKVVYPPVDTNKFKPNEKVRKNKILMVGRIDPFKKYELVLEKLDKLKLRNIVLIGSVTDKRYYEWLKQRFPLVKFKTNVNDEILVKNLNKAKLFIFTNPQEHFGMVVAEAMSCGIPVLVPKGCGVSEIIENGKNGFLFSEDFSDFLTQFQKAINSSNTIKKNARKTIIEKCSISKFIVHFEKELVDYKI
jgi:glycosyltransferase involved in cell wall biosynthesis